MASSHLNLCLDLFNDISCIDYGALNEILIINDERGRTWNKVAMAYF
jgi:hypothetical protein